MSEKGKLNYKAVEYAKANGKIQKLVDGDGLQLRISPTGSKTWLFDYYTPYTKKRTQLSLGKYPDISLAEARKLRRTNRNLVAQDIDPKEHRDQAQLQQQEAKTNTLEHVANEWLATKQGDISPSYANDIKRSLERHIFPNLGAIPVSELKAPRVIKELKPIAAKGNHETVKRLCQRINEVMIFAVNGGLIDDNRLAGIYASFSKPPKKNMPAITPKELPDLMRSISMASITLTTRCLIEWQLHTLLRPSEASTVEWADIDMENLTLTIPAERMKKKRPHRIPMTPQMLAILEVMKPISGHRQHVFPSSRKPTQPVNKQTANMALKRMGYKDRLVAHGLRSIGSTAMNEQGFNPDAIEACLAHAIGSELRGTYNRSDYFEQRKPIMAWWSDFIEQAATGKAIGSNVITANFK